MALTYTHAYAYIMKVFHTTRIACGLILVFPFSLVLSQTYYFESVVVAGCNNCTSKICCWFVEVTKHVQTFKIMCVRRSIQIYSIKTVVYCFACIICKSKPKNVIIFQQTFFLLPKKYNSHVC